ncbi:MAG: sigma 54-interacting transcriptional regulator [Phycisphaerae bacterium]
MKSNTVSVLVSWLSPEDMQAYARRHGGLDLKDIASVAGSKSGGGKGSRGPLASLLRDKRFDEVHLLSEHVTEAVRRCASELRSGAIVHQVKMGGRDPYLASFNVAKSVLEKVVDPRREGVELSMNLASGTAANIAAWVLLGKTMYDATFVDVRDRDVVTVQVPFDLEADVLHRMLEASDRLIQDSSQLDVAVEFGGITGKSPIIRKAVMRATKIAPRDVNVLLLGESGVGKEVFAHAIHKESLRRSKEIVEVNCAALPTNLLESELFGHVKGAFTDAKERRAGKFEVAHEGTLFLDEVAECDLQMQAKLLRVLQPPRESRPTTRCFSPVGADDVKRVDVRIIAATNRDLRREIEAGRFREDLYYRLAGVTIHIPPLRERGGDMVLVAEALLAHINEDFSRAGVPGYVEKKLNPSARKFIRSYAWPGNIRQLRNALTQAAALVDGAEIGERDLREGLADLDGSRRDDGAIEEGFSLDEHIRAIEREYIRRALEQTSKNKTAAARLLGYASYQRLDACRQRLGL